MRTIRDLDRERVGDAYNLRLGQTESKTLRVGDAQNVAMIEPET